MTLKSFFNFFPTPRFMKFAYVGCEISKDCFRYAELTKMENGNHLGRHGEIRFPVTEDIFESEDVKKAIREMKEKDNIDFVKAVLPEQSTYLFTLEVEGDTLEEIRNYIEFHFEENVPIAGGEALFDFYLLSGTEKKKAVVSAVSSKIVDRYVSLFSECGVEVVAFMVDSSALSKSLVKKGDKDTYLIVRATEYETVCFVVSSGFVHFSATMESGGNMITDSISKNLNISKEEASKKKYEIGFSHKDPEDVLFESIVGAISVMRDEAQRASIFWSTHMDEKNMKPIKNIILTGKEATVPGFADYLSSTLKLPVEIANVWKNIPVYENEIPAISFKDSLNFGSCIGLSL